MDSANLTLVAAILCYLVASVSSVRLSTEQRVWPLAGFGATLATLASESSGFKVAGTVAVISAFAEAAIRRLLRMNIHPAASHVAMFAFATAGSELARTLLSNLIGRRGSVAPFLAAASIYMARDVLHAVRGGRGDARFTTTERVRAVLWSDGSFVSIAGLGMLGLPFFGWLALVLPLGGFIVSAAQYRQMAEAESTYRQTVTSLGKLAEAAGFAGAGHHERCAARVLHVAGGFGLRGERVRTLEFAALMHHAGMVSLPGPDEATATDANIVAAHSIRLMEDAGLPSRAIDVITGRGSPETSLDHEILQAACSSDAATTVITPANRGTSHTSYGVPVRSSES